MRQLFERCLGERGAHQHTYAFAKLGLDLILGQNALIDLLFAHLSLSAALPWLLLTLCTLRRSGPNRTGPGATYNITPLEYKVMVA